MTWWDEPRPAIKVRGGARQAGFTLLEMILVVAILAFSLTLIVGYRPPWSGGLSVRGTASELAAALRLARSQAISRDGPVSLVIDLPGHRYRVGDGPEQRVPSNLRVEFLTLANERIGTNTGEIRFNPDGSSTGGRVIIGNGTHALGVGVAWLNGRVSIGDAR